MKYLIGLTLCVLLVLEVTYAQSPSERPTRGPRSTRGPRTTRDRPTRPPRTPRPPPPTGRPSRPPPPARCESTDECQAGECCIVHDYTIYRKGVCLRNAEEGKRCSLPERSLNGRYLHSCPCVSGLECKAKIIKDIPFVGEIRINERCARSDATTPQPEPEVSAAE